MADELDPRIVQAATLILKRTRAGLIQWEIPIRTRFDVFEYSTPRSTFRIGSVDGDSSAPYFIEVYDVEGIKVDEVSRVTDSFDPDIAALYKTVDSLYALARRNALKTDEVLDDLLRDLADEIGETDA